MSTDISLFEINGIIDPNNSVFDNLQTLATASGCWPTYDTHTGKWCVVINRPGDSVFSFDDDNIVGEISVTTTSIDQLYNSVLVEFPNVDILDTTDSIFIEIEDSRRYTGELDRTMNMKFDIINNPVHARIIASRELKQNRVDKVIQFKTDFTMVGLQAGDIIDVTSVMYGFIEKKYRVISVEETDTDTGALLLSIIALEYDADVYSDAGLTREIRNKQTGITPQSINTNIQSSISSATGVAVGQAVSTPTGRSAITGAGIPIFATASSGWSYSQVKTAFETDQFLGTVFQVAGGTGPAKMIQVILETPFGYFTYDTNINGSSVSRTILSNFPCTAVLQYSADNTTFITPVAKVVNWQVNTTVMTLTNAPQGYYRVRFRRDLTYDLNQETTPAIYGTAWDPVINGQGDAATARFILYEN